MIVFNEQKRIFSIEGKNYQYVLCVNDAGFLQKLHYGKKLAEADANFLKYAAEKDAPDAQNANMDMQFDGMQSECGFFGRGDYREATVLCERTDGGLVSRFRYVSHAVYQGAPEISGLPHVRQADDTLKITLQDDFSSLQVDLFYVAKNDGDVLVKYAVYRNGGNEPIRLRRAFSLCTELENRNYRLLRLEGGWGEERTPETTPIGHGITRLHSLRGASSHQMNPFLALVEENTTEENGVCFGFQLVYSGNFALTVERNNNDLLRVQGGINDTDFSWDLNQGESFTTPQVALSYSTCGLGALSRAYADFVRAQIVDPKWAFAQRPIVVNNWEATCYEFNSEKLCPIIENAAKIGADTFVLDDGWFGKRDNDDSSLGDWVVNQQKLEGGFKKIIDCCKRNGLHFGLWIEPEMVSEDSDLFRLHPDWAIQKSGVKMCQSRNQYVLDFSRRQVVDYIYECIAKLLRENEISFVKWDFNRSLSEFYSEALPFDRQGEFAHRFILGVYDLSERLTSSFPNVFFEGCASGGGRFDCGMLYYFPQIWTSDDTDAFERAKIQWGTSICYSVSAMSNHISACPNLQTGRSVSLQTRGVVASLGAMGYELDVSKISADEQEEMKKQIFDYKRVESLILNGDLFRLSNPFTSNYFCEMIVDKEKRTAYIVGMQVHNAPSRVKEKIRLIGLDEGKIYFVEELGVSASGKALSVLGLEMPKRGDFTSWTWHIKEIID